MIFIDNRHPRRKTCMLMVTHQCNLNCIYCYEHFKSAQMMSFETAKKCILLEVEKVKGSDQFKELEIQFMGGEPFMNFRLIKQVVEWLENNYLDIPYICFASSNGTLIHGNIRKWLERHRNTIFVGLSYDGSVGMQSTNRGVAPIDVDWFIHTWPNQGMHMTVSKETLPNLSGGVIELQRKGGRCTVALAQGVKWTETDVNLYRRELEILSDFYLEHDGFQPVEPLMTRSFTGIDKDGHVSRSCGTGLGMTTYDVDGTAYPCHMFTPLVMGGNAQPLRDASVCDNCDLADERCKGCTFINWCPTCYGINLAIRGDVRKRDEYLCKMICTQVEIVSEFQLRYFHKMKRRIDSADIERLVAALDVYERIQRNDIHIPMQNGKEVKNNEDGNP